MLRRLTRGAVLVTEKVTTPLGMQTAFPEWDEATSPRGSNGYLNEACVAELKGDDGSAEAGEDTTDWYLTSFRGGGGGNSDLHDRGSGATPRC